MTKQNVFLHVGEHPRECTWIPSSSAWMYLTGADVWTPCNLPHITSEMPEDRGDLGMPTLGVKSDTQAMLIGTSINAGSVRIGAEGLDLIQKINVQIDGTDVKTAEARRILDSIPRIMQRFLHKNRKYASVQTGHDLGAKGIMPDINRKTGVLMDRLWYGNGEVDEGSIEVIDDLIGHLLLLRDKLENES